MRRATAMRGGRGPSVDFDDMDSPLRRAFKRNIAGAVGLSLTALAAALAASLATWSVSDPSFNHATDEPVRNALGMPGAVFADLLMQSIGLATAIFLVPVVLWGWRLLSGKAHRIARRRIFAWVAGTMLAAGSLAALPVPDNWPLPTGLGGFIGDFVHILPGMITNSLTEGMATIVGTFGLGVPALLLLLRAAGWLGRDEGLALEPRRGQPAATFDEDDEDEDDDGDSRLSAMMGAVAHFGLLTGSTLRRAVFGRRGGSRAPAADSYDDWDDDDEEVEEDYEARPARRSKLRAVLDWALPREDDGLDELYPHQQESRRLPRVALPVDEDMDDGDDWPLASGPGGANRPVPQGIAGPSTQPRQAAGEPAGRVVPPAPRPKQGKRIAAESQPSLLGAPEHYEMPPLRLLAEPKASPRSAAINTDALEQNARLLEGVLEDFGVNGEIIKVRPGPVVTLYELEPAPGIKSSRVIGLADDIARSMSAIAAVSRSSRAATPSASNCRTSGAKRSICANCWRRRTSRKPKREAGAGARQDHRRRAGHRRSRQDAASAGRRHHRFGQVGRDQHDDPVDPVPA